MKFINFLAIVFLGISVSCTVAEAGERIQFSVKNQTFDNGVYSADVWAKMPSSGTSWTVGSCNILLNYNDSALDPDSFNNDTATNRDPALSLYSITQTQAGTGRIALNILDPGGNNLVTKSALDSFRIASVRWTVTDSTDNDDLSFFTNGTEVYEGLSTALSYNCSTPSCYTVVEPGSNSIIDGDPLVVTQPEDQEGCAGGSVSFAAEATGTPVPSIQWQLDAGSGFNNISSASATTTTLTLTNLNSGYDGWLFRAKFNNGGDDVYSDTAELTILTTTLTVTAPAADQLLTAGVEYTITWNHTFCTDSISEVALKYSTNAGVNYSTIAITENDGSYAWTVPTVVTEEAVIKVISTQWQNIDAVSGEFTIQVSSSTVAVPWTFTAQTGNNSTIIVPSTATMSIGERDLMVGDAVGTFYSVAGTEYCAGYVVWPDSSTAFAVWGDDDQTPVVDGYVNNQDYYLKLWDGQEGVEYPAQVAFSLGNDYYTQDTWSVILSLSAVTDDTLNIVLESGWNMISSNVEPESLLMTTVLSDINNNVTIAKDGSGNVYVPLFGINNIGSWDMSHGYQLYMASNDTLSIVGTPVDPTSVSVPVATGWNLVSYLRSGEQNAATALTSISSNLTIAKDGSGNVYVPLFGINNIGNMKPGEGYQMYLTTADSIEYPANNKLGAVGVDVVSAKYIIPESIKTGENATILLQASDVGNGIEVGAFTISGMLVGSGVVNAGVAAVTVWGDNSQTEQIDGAMAGEIIVLRVWDPSTSREIALEVGRISNFIDGHEEVNIAYQKDGVLVAESNVVFGAANELVLAPNPARDNVQIQLSEAFEGTTSIVVFDHAGQQVLHVLIDSDTEVIDLDVSQLASGSYILEVRGTTQTLSQKLTIVR